MEESMYDGAMPKHRLSRNQKNKEGKKWYKQYLDYLDGRSFSTMGYRTNGFESFEEGGVSEVKRMQVNYDLFNNIINIKDFEYVAKPYGAQEGELPANFTNRDIVSSKIKVLLGMEMKRPFSWKVLAVNEEATTRREQEEFKRMKEFVKAEIMKPIQMELEQRKQEELQGQELTPEQQQQIQQQIQQELAALTPPEVRKYMEREHQDPAEALAHQILEYLFQKESIANKFNKGFKHLAIAAKEIYWVGQEGNDPVIRVINPLYFDYDKSPDLDTIEDGEWAVCEYRWSPSKVISEFADELTNVEIDEIYSYCTHNQSYSSENMFNFADQKEDDGQTVRVLHGTWKALRKIGFLTYFDENGIQERIEDESYTLNKEAGDLSISWTYITEVYEGYKIGKNLYKRLRPVPGQAKDLDNLYESKLPYIGVVMDSTNSLPTSLIDRIKGYQYYYNIIMYRIELLMASDKGKLLMMNIGLIPESAGIDVEKWLYFLESSKIGFMNPKEEGDRGDTNITNSVKEIDMSLASDIQKYINLAEYIERRAGISIGVPPEAEGQIGPNNAVTNTKQTMVQSSHVTEPIFDLHNHVKKNVLQSLLEVAKTVYAENPTRKLAYILDDLSRKVVEIDSDLLDNSTYGLFVSNSTKAHEAKDLVAQLAHAAMQSQKVDLSDVIKVVRAEGIQEAEELLVTSESKKREEMQKEQMAQLEKQKEIEQMRIQENKEARVFDRETRLLVEKEKTSREIQTQAMMSMGFNEDKDVDKDGKLDILEVAKQGVDVDIKQRKQQLDEKKFKHQQENDKKKIELEKEKLNKTKKSN